MADSSDFSYANGRPEPVPGDVILSCSITNFDGSETQDITLQVQEVSTYESLFSDHIRAEIIYSDSLALATRMPIVGQETASIMFQTPSVNEQTSEPYKKIQMSLSVVRMEKVHWNNIRSGVYKLECVSPYRIQNLQQIVQNPYGPGKISDFVKQVCKDFLGIEGDDKLEVEETVGDHKFVIPSMSPFQTLHFFADEAASSQSIGSDYLFWQDWEKHHFVTVQSLIKGKSGKNFDQLYYVTEQSLNPDTSGAVHGNDTPRQGADKHKNPAEWYFIRAMNFDRSFDVENGVKNGLYDNQIYWIDTLLQQYEVVKPNGTDEYFNYLRDFNDFAHTAERKASPLVNDKAAHAQGKGQSHIRFLIANPNQNMADHQNTPRQRQNFLGHLISTIEQLDQIRGWIVVPGDTDRKPGDMIVFDLHEIGSTDDIIGELNKYLSGSFLVTGVRHKYTENVGFYTIMEILKNCYEHEIERAEIKDRDGTVPEERREPVTEDPVPGRDI